MNQKNEMKAFFVFSTTVVGQLSGTSYARTFNVLIAKENTNEWQITMKDLGQAQQVAQLRLSKFLGEDFKNFTTEDVVINNINYLGQMTQKEFEAK